MSESTVTVPAVLEGETERAYLVRLGLAKPTRGRLSREAHAALDAAKAAGHTFVVVEKPSPAPKPAVSSAPAPARVKAPAAGSYDAKEVRAWAAQNGYKVGDRGRIPTTVIEAFRKVDGNVTVPAARPTPLLMPKRTNIRGLATANGITHAQSICGNRSCGRSIPMCQCPNGPQALGGVKGTLRLV